MAQRRSLNSVSLQWDSSTFMYFYFSLLSEILIGKRVLLLKTSFKNTYLVQYPHWTEEETEAKEER